MQYTVARSSAPSCYPPRVQLEPSASWDKLPQGYDPVEFTDPSVLANAEDLDTGKKWADVPLLAVRHLGTLAGPKGTLKEVQKVTQSGSETCKNEARKG